MKYRGSFVIRDFTCPECGIVMQASKVNKKITGKGHKKDMFCYKCKKIQKFTQVGVSKPLQI